MARRRTKGLSAERFVEQTLAVIAEKGSSRGVNLREISRRVGCAHTNAYNYFASLEELLWEAYRRGLRIYCEALVDGLDDSLTGQQYFHRLIGNMVDFAVANPGLHRFISSDPRQPESFPEDVIASVTQMKMYFVEVIAVLCERREVQDGVEVMANILLAYVDGETFNLINGRVLPDEDIVGRVQRNAERLFTLLTATTCDGINLSLFASRDGRLPYPRLEISP